MKRMIGFFAALTLLLGGCAPAEQHLSQTLFSMDTVMELQIWTDRGDDVMNTCVQMLQNLEKTWSATDEDSLLSRRNAGAGDVTLDDEQMELLNRALELKNFTGGAFDPTIGAISQVWGFYDGQYRVPEDEEVLQAMFRSQWDLGAVMKGYAGDACVKLLEESGARCGLLNLGGNIQTYGTKPDGRPWNIGIQNPDGGESVAVLSINGTMAVVTSGDYQRYFEIDGVKYHHIIDPKSGYPASSGLRSVTVICRDGMTADALSTALFVMGLHKGSNFWRNNEGFEVVFITTGGDIYATQGVAISGCEYEVISREE